MITYEYVIQRKRDGMFYRGPGFTKFLIKAYRYGTYPAAACAIHEKSECVIKVKLTWSIEAAAMDSECN